MEVVGEFCIDVTVVAFGFGVFLVLGFTADYGFL